MDHTQRDYVLLLDRSGSMGEVVSKSNSQSRWKYAEESTKALARRIGEFDSDGIDVYPFGSGFQKITGVTADKVAEIFTNTAPNGGTDFVPVLTEVFAEHFRKGNKPTTVIVMTDGEPSNGDAGKKALKDLIVATTKKLEGDAELAVSFLQVGDDPAATKFLKELDDDLVKAGAKFDIVDTKTFADLEGMSAEEFLTAAVND